jgi:hypothetical protein
VHLDTIKVYYSPTNAQVIVLKNNIKIYIKIAPAILMLILNLNVLWVAYATRSTLKPVPTLPQ